MRADLGWNLAQAGALTTANGLGYLAGAVAAAPVARWLTETVTFRLGMVLTAAALALTATTSSFPWLLVTRAAAGVSGALVFIAGGVLAARNAAGRGSAAPLAVYFAGGGLGIAVSGVAIPPLLSQHSNRWPLAWAGLAVAAALAAVVSWTAASPTAAEPGAAEPGAAEPGAAGSEPGPRAASSEPGPRPAMPGREASLFDAAAVGRLWRVAAAYLLFAAGYIAYITFLSAYLAAHRAGVVQVTVTWALLGLAAVVAPALWSRPINAWPGTTALAAALAVLAAAAAVALISVAPAAIAISAVGYGASFLAVPAAVAKATQTANPRARWTAALAAFTAVFAIGQTAGPYLAGVLADHYGVAATLVWTAALCAGGAALSAVARPLRG
jgi:predicted MFS family arabinose efflux permease